MAWARAVLHVGIIPKISRGTIEILSDVQLSKTGDNVGASKATLLSTLTVSPSSSGLIIQQVSSSGGMHNPEVLDITEETAFPLPGGRLPCCQRVCADWLPSCCIGSPFCHQWVRAGPGFVETAYTFPLAEKVRTFLPDLIPLHLWLLPPLPPLLLPQPQPRLKQRKNQRSRTRIGIWSLAHF